MMLDMSDKTVKSDKQAGFRLPSAVVESLMRFKPPPVKKTPMYVAALAFYIEAAERFGIDAELRPKVSFIKAKEGLNKKNKTRSLGFTPPLRRPEAERGRVLNFPIDCHQPHRTEMNKNEDER